MMYRVLTRQDGQREWRAATPPTSNWKAAQVALDRVRRFFAEGLLVEAKTDDELARRVQEYCDLNGDSAPTGAKELEAHRWELERGPGGDHDEPYVFALPTSVAMQSAWGRLLARVEGERRTSDSKQATMYR